tara:strand:+ start:1443 stop:1865 length:423 start_codon:yes stop_codon:yes gene_type:complete
MDIFNMIYLDEDVEAKYLVEVNAEQVKKLARMVSENHLTEAMRYLSKFVYDDFRNVFNKTSVHDTDTYIAHRKNLYIGCEFMKAIHECEVGLGRLPEELKAMRNHIYNITLRFVFNDIEVAVVLIDSLECAINESKTADE